MQGQAPVRPCRGPEPTVCLRTRGYGRSKRQARPRLTTAPDGLTVLALYLFFHTGDCYHRTARSGKTVSTHEGFLAATHSHRGRKTRTDYKGASKRIIPAHYPCPQVVFDIGRCPQRAVHEQTVLISHGNKHKSNTMHATGVSYASLSARLSCAPQ